MSNRTLTCLIVEDEPIAAEVLEDYITQVAFLELRGICTDAIAAMDRLRDESIDVIFLDIHLPRLKGLDFLRSLTHRPQVILTTAYHEYALDAFEEGVVDYLMKPIAFSRFLKAVNKLTRHAEPAAPALAVSSERPFRFFNVNKSMVKVYYDDILYVESLKDYAKIVTAQEEVVTRGHIGEMENLLKEQGFLRIHRSYLVAVSKISAFSATDVVVGGTELPIGRSYKELVKKVLEAFSG